MDEATQKFSEAFGSVLSVEQQTRLLRILEDRTGVRMYADNAFDRDATIGRVSFELARTKDAAEKHWKTRSILNEVIG